MPSSAEELTQAQGELGRLTPEPWRPPLAPIAVGGCFAAFERGVTRSERRGERAWAAAVVVREGRTIDRAQSRDSIEALYEPGLLFLRAGPILLAALRALRSVPDVVLVNGTGRDHPRRAGLALHLGALLDAPTVGVTHRPLVSRGEWPTDEVGARSPLTIDGEVAGCWLRVQAGARPLAVHAAWRTDTETAAAVVLGALGPGRTPEPIRHARRLARSARAADA